MSFWQTFGLTLALISLGVTFGALACDAWRAWITRVPTISEGIWTQLALWRAGDGSFPWMVVVIPIWMSLAGVGMLLHFLAP